MEGSKKGSKKGEGKMSYIDGRLKKEMQQMEHLGKVLKMISEELCQKRSKSLPLEEEEGEEEKRIDKVR